jgi:putative RecB family exonuclease
VPPVFSHSRLSSFENCPKQFHFRYVLKIESPSESVEAFLGKRVHEVLERLYRFVKDGRVPSVDKVVHRFRAFWTEQFDPTRITITRSEFVADTYREIGERCLRNHYRRHYPFDGDETLALEEHVSFALDDGGQYLMQGIIDRLVRTRDGTLEIHDFKTGARVPPQRVLDEDRQLALYQLGLRRRYGDDTPVRLVWHYLQAGMTLSSQRTREQLDTLRDKTVALIDRIQAEERFAPKPGPLCDWCEYRGYCPAFEAERAAAAPIPDPIGDASIPPFLDPALVAEPTPPLGAVPRFAQLSLFGGP